MDHGTYVFELIEYLGSSLATLSRLLMSRARFSSSTTGITRTLG